MIPVTKDVTVLSNVSADTIDMDIAPDQYRHLMSILTNMYEDTTAAVIREYITNALDSHKASGQTRPIEVNTPNRLNPAFTVEDFGLGMSVDDIRNTYARYGASTKRDSNTEAGSFGIGSKSGLAYGTGQFNVTAIKDGTKAVVLVGIREDGTGSMDIVSVTDTDQANGVKISIPVNSNFDNFTEKVRQFHRFVTPGKMLVDGQGADHSDFDQINERLAIIGQKSYGYQRRNFLVMGDVYYPISNTVYGNVHNNFNVVIYADIGEVHITPSREQLNYTKQTREVLDKYSKMFSDSILNHMQIIIDLQPTKREAFNKRRELALKLDYANRKHPFTYNGVPLPELDGLVFNQVEWNWSSDRYCRNHGEATLQDVYTDMLYIKNWSLKRFTRLHADKIDAYLKANDMAERRRAFMLTGADFDSELFEDSIVIDWDEVSKVKLGRRVAAGKPARKYLGGGGGLVYGENYPDPTKNIWYGSKSDLGGQYFSPNYRSIAAQFTDDNNQFFYVTDTERDKFLRTYPTAQRHHGFYKAKVEKYLKDLSAADRKTIEFRYELNNGSMLKADDVLDPELADILRYHEQVVDNYDVINAYDKIMEIYNKMLYTDRQALADKMPKTGSDSTFVEKLAKRYPLLVGFYTPRSNISDSELSKNMTQYVNNVYNELT